MTELAMLKLLLHSGVTDLVGDMPVNRMAFKQPEASKSPERKETLEALKATEIPDLNWADIKTLDDLRSEIVKSNQPLKKTARAFLFGEGNPNAKALFLDGMPSLEDDQNGAVLTGKPGNLFDAMIGAIDLTRKDIFLMPITPYRPPAGRKLGAHEKDLCAKIFKTVIALVKPDIIVCLGDGALSFADEKAAHIDKERGEIRRIHSTKMLAMYHPATLLNDPSKKKSAWEDLKKVREELQNAK